MLINVVEIVENPERVLFGRAICFVVRLQPLDECRRLLGNPACNPRRSLLTLFVRPEIRFGFEDGKVRLGGRRAAVGKNELPSEVVQAGPEVMETISHKDAKTQGRRLPDVKAVDMARTFFIALMDDLVRLIVHVSPVLPIERVEVFFCPDDFESGSIEWMSHN